MSDGFEKFDHSFGEAVLEELLESQTVAFNAGLSAPDSSIEDLQGRLACLDLSLFEQEL